MKQKLADFANSFSANVQVNFTRKMPRDYLLMKHRSHGAGYFWVNAHEEDSIRFKNTEETIKDAWERESNDDKK